jgi:hypothetical protein
MDAATPLPDFGEARDAMQRAIEEARAKAEILEIFIRANQISADATVRSRRKRNSTSHYAFREIALRADRLRGQWLKDLEKAGRRFMGRPEEGVKIGTPPPPHLIVLDDLDLGGNAGRRESQDLQLLADMSAAAFEVLVANPTAPRPRSGPEKRILSLSEIRIDPCVQPRAALKDRVVDEYAEAMQRGAKFPAPVVFEDAAGVCWLSDGHHTCAAAIKLKLKTIECDVRKGGLRDATLFACGANAAHGLPRSNEDKHRVVRRLLEDPEWGKWSDSEIARRCKVDHKFVAKLREQLRPIDLGISQDSSRTVSRGGTTYTMSTGNIGRSRAPAPEPDSTEPELPFKPAPEPTESAPEPVSQPLERPQEPKSSEPISLAPEVEPARPNQPAEPAPPPDPWAHQRAAFYGFIIGIKSIDFDQMIAPMPLEELRDAKDVFLACSAALDAAIERATPAAEQMPPAA